MSQTEVQLIKDAVIVNADISNSAAIDVSKISGAMPLAGGTFTNDVTFDGATAGRDILFDRSNNFLKFKDNAKISLGTDDDANLYYDGTNPILYAGTNTLRIVADNIHLEAGDFGDEFLRCIHDGAVELYYDNSKKLETAGHGINITGGFIATGSSLVNDNGKIQLGTGSDLQLFHDGSNSFITNVSSGGFLHIRSGSGINLQDNTGDENFLKCIDNGAVELYYDNSKKLETTSSGISVTGQADVDSINCTGELDLVGNLDLNSDSHKIKLGAGDDFQFYHDGSNNYIFTNNGDIIMQTSGDDIQLLAQDDIILKVQGGVETAINCVGDGAVELYHNNSKKLETLSDGVNVTGTLKVNGSAFTGGKCVKQLASFTFNAFNTTDSAFSDVLSVDFTPTSSSSLIVFDFTAANSSVGNSSGGSATLGIRLIKDNSTIINATNATDFAVGNGEPDRISSSLLVRHMEGNSNTNQRTYKVQFNREAGNTNATLSNGLGIIIREFV